LNVQKEEFEPEKKNRKKLSQTLRAYNSQMCEYNLGMWMKVIPVQQGSTELCMRENCALVLPVNILTV